MHRYACPHLASCAAAGQSIELVIPDANPLEKNIHTQKIWKVLQSGRVIDRNAQKGFLKKEAEEAAYIK